MKNSATKPDRMDLNDLPPTINIDTAAAILGCGRSLAYDLARRGEFPCRVIRLGRRYVIPTAELLRVVGVSSDIDTEQLRAP
jgi:predicted DNA-binding transcriptional regulator AlpA